METVHSGNEELAALFRAMSKPGTIGILILAGRGIANSTHAIEELGTTPKRYYSRLNDLLEAGLVKKREGVYRQTALGGIIQSRIFPTILKACEYKDRLGILEQIEGTPFEHEIRRVLANELDLLELMGSTRISIMDDYEALAIEAVDLYDSAEESVLLASNYFDVRVMEAFLRAKDRGIENRVIVGKRSLSSKMKSLKTILSFTFTKALISFASNTVDLKKTVRYTDLPYTFCVVDGHLNVIEISNLINERFIVALSIDDEVVGEKLTEFYELLWEVGEFHSAIEAANSIRSKLKGETSH